MSEHDGGDRRIPPPEGTYPGVPYDWRTPSLARARARMWNPDDPRIFTPKTFGWGWDINFYWLAHPMRLVWGRRAR